jgi:hypothetical protein
VQGQAAGASRTSFLVISAHDPSVTVTLYVNSSP